MFSVPLLFAGKRCVEANRRSAGDTLRYRVPFTSSFNLPVLGRRADVSRTAGHFLTIDDYSSFKINRCSLDNWGLCVARVRITGGWLTRGRTVWAMVGGDTVKCVEYLFAFGDYRWCVDFSCGHDNAYYSQYIQKIYPRVGMV